MIRGMDLRGAVALNVITMIGIGPLVTIPLVLANLHGGSALWAWIVGAAIACCDGLVYAELGSLYPGSGGTYVFLREAFGPERWGRLFAFVFAWQFVISIPLLVASGYIGFAQYAGYFWAPLASDARLQGILAAALGIVTLLVLYRPIRVAGAIGIALAGIAVATLGALVAAGVAHGAAPGAFVADPGTPLAAVLVAGLGPSLVLALYDYAGYGQATTIGDEIRDPARVLPRSILISVLAVAALYVAAQLAVLAVIPWRELVPAAHGAAQPALANYVASSVVERVWGAWPARIVTLAVLVTAFASTYGNLLGASRVPYAAARDGVFFGAFARLHPRGRFPGVSLVVLGLLALPACFLRLADAIDALTAGMVLVQSVLQIGALAALRARGARAPYRMWLYPLPALVALAGWIAIFIASGAHAIAFGLVSLTIGIVVYLIRARRAADWPFRTATGASALFVVFAVSLVAVPHEARAAGGATRPSWAHARVVARADGPIFEVDGAPFFVYGAAFFYERLPRDEWRASLLRLKALGINTLDLYVPWNWHELADGDFDFDGRTNPRRDLATVLRLARELDFKLVLRPGPVVRNEWRNGGYPAWLLERPEYGMPEHDRLEGRYPPTATLQNAHSDDAAAAWLRNATHLYYARRWLGRVLHECAPDADRIVAIALDDDQAAYVDNQTWPAPHLRAYLEWLRAAVRSVTGSRELVFINTYQMKVTASSPVWAMGNWYQSDAYALAEHDRAQLEYSTALLHTRPGQPMMASEFQAGWLLQPDDVRPRPADPSNTALALASMFGLGVRGVVLFPAQDTLYPSGWDAPFANAFYAWDAALALDGTATARAAPTAAFGALVSTYGADLASSHVRYDAAVAYLGGSTSVPRATNAFFADVETATIVAQRACRDARLACALVDPAALDARALARYPLLVVPSPSGVPVKLRPDVRARLAAYARGGGTIVPLLPGAELARAYARTGRMAAVTGAADATFSASRSRRLDGFLAIVNYDGAPRVIPHAVVTLDDGTRRALPRFSVPRHSALVVPIGVRLAAYAHGFSAGDRLAFTTCMPRSLSIAGGRIVFRDVGDTTTPCFARVRFNGVVRDVAIEPRRGAAVTIAANETTYVAAPLPPIGSPAISGESGVPIRADVSLPGPAFDTVSSATPTAYRRDVYRDGSQAVVLDNGIVRLVVVPDAGARAFCFADDRTGRNVFTTVGAMRDDVVVEPPLSTTDRIARYTHDFPAGTFNRTYDASIDATAGIARATFRYTAPDVVPAGATFERTVSLEPGARTFQLDERADFGGAAFAKAQRAVSVTSLSVGDGTDMTSRHLLLPGDDAFAAGTTAHVAGHAFGYYDTVTHELATVAWRDGDVDDATILERRFSLVLRLTLAPARAARVRFGFAFVPDLANARDAVALAGTAVAGT